MPLTRYCRWPGTRGDFIVRFAAQRAQGFAAKDDYLARVSLSAWDKLDRPKARSPGYVLLDAVALEDLDRCLADRKARRSYIEHIALITELRQILRADRTEQRDLRNAAERRSAGPADDFNAMFCDAVRQWRAQAGGRQVPAVEDAEFHDALEAILQSMSNALALRSGERPAMLDCREAAYALSDAGNGRYFTYEAPPPGELAPAPFATRRSWRLRKDRTLRFEREVFAPYSDPMPPNESLVWRAAGCARNFNGRPRRGTRNIVARAMAADVELADEHLPPGRATAPRSARNDRRTFGPGALPAGTIGCMR